MKQLPIEAIGFDFDHTLGLDNKLERTVALELGRRLGGGVHAEFCDPGTGFDSFIARYRNGSMSLDAALVRYFETFVPGLDLGAGDHTEIVAEFKSEAMRRAGEFVRPLPGAIDLLADLGAMGLPHAILTNGWSPLQEEKARLIGFHGSVLVSEVIGAWKPARDAFRALSAHFGKAPETIAYVGDDPTADIGGALAAGMRAVWFDWEGRAYPEGLPAPTYRVGALGELDALLQGPFASAANPAP